MKLENASAWPPPWFVPPPPGAVGVVVVVVVLPVVVAVAGLAGVDCVPVPGMAVGGTDIPGIPILQQQTTTF